MAGFTEEQFVALVKKSEAEAARNIGAYKTKLALFALLGYVVIFAVLATLVLLVGGTVGIALFSSSLFLLLLKKKLIFVILFAIWTFLKALWVKFEAPTGHVLERDDYPALFDEIDKLTRALDALKIHQVILENNLNAAVLQHPRFGVLGGQQNTLMLGLQLLLALSPEEMRSVLAHEFGHLSGNHSRFSGWIYRVRVTWSRVMATFDASNSFGAGLMRRFFDWYAPTFSAYSFALARSNEYEADRVAAELTSPQTAAKALVNVHTKAPYIEKEFWEVFFKNADEMPEPPVLPFEGLADFLKRSPISRDTLLALVKQSMQMETHYADTHPALKDRVNGITGEAVLPETFDINAAEAWLGDRYRTTLAHFDRIWLEANAQRWKDRFEYVQQARALLREAEGADLDTLNDDKLWQLAQTTLEFTGDEAALPLYQRFQARHPESAGAAYYIGRILVAREDEQALPYLRVAFNNPNTLGDAAHWGHDLLLKKGREKEAEQWWQDALRANEQHRAAAQERSVANLQDSYEEPVISQELLADLKQQLSAHKNVGAVWLAQKALAHPGGSPVYIIAFRPKGFYWSFDAAMQSVTQSLRLDVNLFVVSLWGSTGKLAKKVKKAGTKIK